MRRFFAVACVLACSAGLCRAAEEKKESIAWESYKRFFKMDFTLKPAAESLWQTSDDEKGRQIWTAAPYRLEMNFERISSRSAVINYKLTRTDGKAFSILSNNVEIKSSQSGVYKIFNPTTMQQQNYKIDLPHMMGGASRAITATPVIWMQDTAGSNTFTVGMIGQYAQTDMSGFTYNLNNGGEAQGIANSYVRISFKRQWHNDANAVSFEDGIYINADESISWFGALEDYSKAVDRSRNYKPAAPGAIAFNPMWHTWYAHAAGIDQNEVLIDTKLAAALGFRTFQIDGGWNFPASAGDRYSTTLDGDYDFHPERFSDPKGMIKQMHEMGVKVIVHVSPFIMGNKSRTYAQMADCLVRVDGKPLQVLDPRLAKTRDFLLKAWEKLLVDYKADGLWYDFMEQIPTKADKPADGMELVSSDMQEAYTLVMKALYDRARQLNPDVVIVLRRNSANLNSKIYCTHVWPMDAPQDYNMNRRDIVYMKTFGEGVLTHACCTSWPISESDKNVARQMASIVLAGVPALSIKLAESPQRHNDIIRAWLKWYNQNDKDLVTGQMTPLLPTPPSAAIRIETDKQAFFGFFEAVTGLVTVTKPVKKVTLVNEFSDRLATRLEGISGKFEMKVYDANWKLISTSTVKTDKSALNINVADNSGCFSVVLTKK